MKQFLIRLSDNSIFKTLTKEPLTYVTGATLLAVLQIAHYAIFKGGWGILAPFSNWGAWLLGGVGVDVTGWSFYSSEATKKALEAGVLKDGSSIRNFGVIVGALMAALFASQFKFKFVKSWRQVAAAIIGGLLMGYGARISNGCNIGVLFTGVISLSLSGWVYMLGAAFGAFVGGRLLIKFFM